MNGPAITLFPRDYDAVLFDLDGVLTQTASVHAVAWKTVFDEFLKHRSAADGKPFVPFDIDADYRLYVDGKPRYDGVVDFLKSRAIELPWDAPEGGAGVPSVHALGTLKDKYFLEQLQQWGVKPYEGAITLVRTLRAQQVKTAVVSSSNNCAAVLEAAGIAELFDARVDGLDSTRLDLKGKPAPDGYLEAARRLRIEPSRAVVVEDAIAGVEAGRAGRFGCVIGVDRSGQSQALRQAGADVVVTHVAQIRVSQSPPRRGRCCSRGSTRRRREFARPCAPWGMAISRLAQPQPQPGRWRMTFTIRGPPSPVATTACAPTLQDGWSRTRIWSISPTGSRSAFRSPMRTRSIRGQSRSCHTAKNSICGSARCCGRYVLRIDTGDALCCRSDV